MSTVATAKFGAEPAVKTESEDESNIRVREYGKCVKMPTAKARALQEMQTKAQKRRS